MNRFTQRTEGSLAQWRIRISLPDDPASRSALSDVLAGQPAARLRELPGRSARSAATGQIRVGLPQDDGLVTVLSELHRISPQVFVSRADLPEPEPAP